MKITMSEGAPMGDHSHETKGKTMLLEDLGVKAVNPDVIDLSNRQFTVQRSKQTDGSTKFNVSLIPFSGIEVIHLLSACSTLGSTFEAPGVAQDWIELYAAFRKGLHPEENWSLTRRAHKLLDAHSNSNMIGDNIAESSRGFTETLEQLEPLIQQSLFASLFQAPRGSVLIVDEDSYSTHLIDRLTNEEEYRNEGSYYFLRSIVKSEYADDFLEYVTSHPDTIISQEHRDHIQEVLVKRKTIPHEDSPWLSAESKTTNKAAEELVVDYFSDWGQSSHPGIFRHVVPLGTRAKILHDFLEVDKERKMSIAESIFNLKLTHKAIYDPEQGRFLGNSESRRNLKSDFSNLTDRELLIDINNPDAPESTWPYSLAVNLSEDPDENGEYKIQSANFENTPGYDVLSGVPDEIAWKVHADGRREILPESSPLGIAVALVHSPAIHKDIPGYLPFYFKPIQRLDEKQHVGAAQIIRLLHKDSSSPHVIHIRERMQESSEFFSAVEAL